MRIALVVARREGQHGDVIVNDQKPKRARILGNKQLVLVDQVADCCERKYDGSNHGGIVDSQKQVPLPFADLVNSNISSVLSCLGLWLAPSDLDFFGHGS